MWEIKCFNIFDWFFFLIFISKSINLHFFFSLICFNSNRHTGTDKNQKQQKTKNETWYNMDWRPFGKKIFFFIDKWIIIWFQNEVKKKSRLTHRIPYVWAARNRHQYSKIFSPFKMHLDILIKGKNFNIAKWSIFSKRTFL